MLRERKTFNTSSSLSLSAWFYYEIYRAAGKCDIPNEKQKSLPWSSAPHCMIMKGSGAMPDWIMMQMQQVIVAVNWWMSTRWIISVHSYYGPSTWTHPVKIFKASVFQFSFVFVSNPVNDNDSHTWIAPIKHSWYIHFSSCAVSLVSEFPHALVIVELGFQVGSQPVVSHSQGCYLTDPHW